MSDTQNTNNKNSNLNSAAIRPNDFAPLDFGADATDFDESEASEFSPTYNAAYESGLRDGQIGIFNTESAKVDGYMDGQSDASPVETKE